MNQSNAVWLIFFAVVLVLLVFDLGILHRRERDISVRESIWLSLFYVAASIGFGLFVFHYVGHKQGRDFFTGYLVEKSLSMDNIFVMSLVFSYFKIPRLYQYRVLFWGILGVLILRGIMIAAGAALIEEFHFVLYLFGAFLLVSGVKMLAVSEKEEKSLKDNKLLTWLHRRIKTTDTLHGNRFFVRQAHEKSGKGVLRPTPLLLVLLFIELADVVFALDSVPAVFAVTTDSFVVYSSNIFAILGLRALYFMLSAMLHRFIYLKYALALVLVFIGGKIFLGAAGIAITSGVSLFVTLSLLAAGIVLSLWKTKA